MRLRAMVNSLGGVLSVFFTNWWSMTILRFTNVQ